MSPAQCDILIVGAGPAGATAAFILASRGLHVVLLDRCAFPRPKLCGGLLTWKTVETLERIFRVGLPALKAAGLVRQESRSYTLGGRRSQALTRDLNDPFYLVDRTQYDEFWLRRAVSAGAEFVPGAAVVVFDPARSHQVLGMAALKSAGRLLKDEFRRFLRELDVPGADGLRLHAHGLPYGSYLKTPGWRNALLVGDAAGLADPILGEGIYYAHRSAELAARAVMDRCAQPETALCAYRAEFRRQLLPEMRYAWAGRQVFFALPPSLHYPFLGLFLRLAPKIAEETIQGRRSFRWFRFKTPCPR